ncbi:2-hydroxyacid dehydrogenase [soil metagenome]
MSVKPCLLVLVFITEEHRALVARHHELIYAPNNGKDRSNGAAQIAARGRDVRVVLTNGAYGLLPAEVDAMPGLELVCSLGVGYENIAVAHARSRGIAVANAAGANQDCVADHAMTLLLGAARRLPFLNAGVRNGLWRDDIARPPQVSFKRMGIFGLGAIGQAIARRAEGFHMQIGYHSRRRREDSAYEYSGSVLELARWCDFLIVAAPGGQDTHHVIDAEVLTALGPQGVLVNIARGSLVDTDALADALQERRILAAALDVYEGEPAPPARLLAFENAILTPHIAGISPEAIDAAVGLFLKNAARHFAGEALVTPVP